jgi:hypothetical protein
VPAFERVVELDEATGSTGSGVRSASIAAIRRKLAQPFAAMAEPDNPRLSAERSRFQPAQVVQYSANGSTEGQRIDDADQRQCVQKHSAVVVPAHDGGEIRSGIGGTPSLATDGAEDARASWLWMP